MPNPPPLPQTSGNAGKPVVKSKRIAIICVVIVIFVIFVSIMAEVDSGRPPIGTYSRTDTYYGGHSYTSSITIQEGGTILAEIRTGSGAVDRTGTYTLNKTGGGKWAMDVVWHTTEFYNTLGARPSLSNRQTIHVSGKTISIGETTYRK